MNKTNILHKIKERKKTLEQQFSIARIGLFGSYSTGQAHAHTLNFPHYRPQLW